MKYFIVRPFLNTLLLPKDDTVWAAIHGKFELDEPFHLAWKTIELDAVDERENPIQLAALNHITSFGVGSRLAFNSFAKEKLFETLARYGEFLPASVCGDTFISIMSRM